MITTDCFALCAPISYKNTHKNYFIISQKKGKCKHMFFLRAVTTGERKILLQAGNSYGILLIIKKVDRLGVKMENTMESNGTNNTIRDNTTPFGTKPLKEKGKIRMYGRVQKVIASMGCIEQYELQVFIYEFLIRKLKRLDDYKDSKELLKKYEEELRQYKKDGTEAIYQNMLKLQKQVKRAEDIQWVLKEAKRIPEYKDVAEVEEWCKQQINIMEKKEERLACIRIAVVILVIIAIVFVVKQIL